MGGEQGAVAGLGESQCLGKAVHGVRGEHAGAGSAGRAAVALGVIDLLVGVVLVRGHDHDVDEVKPLVLPDLLRGNAYFHRAAGDEDGGDVEAHGREQHARGHLVAVGDADQGVNAMGPAHVLHGVGDDLAARKGVKHAVMAHGDAVVNRDGVELLGDAAALLDFPRNKLSDIMKMDMARNELGEGIGDADDRLAEITVLHSGSAPESAGTSHIAAFNRSGRTILPWHCILLKKTQKRGCTFPCGCAENPAGKGLFSPFLAALYHRAGASFPRRPCLPHSRKAIVPFPGLTS